jgi:hypothetical protein
VGYRARLLFPLPPVPAGSTQFWQTNHVHWAWTGKDCKRGTEDRYIVDIANIRPGPDGRYPPIPDMLYANVPGDYCIFTATVEKHQGFNPPGTAYGAWRNTKEVYDTIDSTMIGPKGKFVYKYLYVNPDNCKNCCIFASTLETLETQGKSETLWLPGIGTFSGTFK